MSVDWVLRHKVASVLIALAVSVLLWWALVEYIDPQDATDRKGIVQVFVLMMVGLVGTLGGIVAVASLQTSQRNLQRQRELEEQRAQDDALQAYFEQIGKLLTDYDLIGTDREDIRQLAQAQTLTVLARLDGPRKGSLVRFLHGAGLINKVKPIVHLIDADLIFAFLDRADLSGAGLSGANLRYADLSNADLSNADLSSADLSGAYLRDANLTGADLSGVEVSMEQLAACKPLERATMPNGQKYEDWLKTKKN
jgi:Pentapeptide repeats (8 copies)